MTHANTRTYLGQIGLLAGLTSLAACSGGGSGGGTFAVNSVSIQPNSTVQINRPIEITFSEGVNFASVNLNTINITRTGGAPAAGEFRYKTVKLNPNDPCSEEVVLTNVIVFQPACPTLDDYSDAGLTPGGFQYRLNVVGSGDDGVTVRSTSGKVLGSSQTLLFSTPASSDATQLFVDPQVNSAPRAVIADPACPTQTKVSYIELGGDDTNRVKFVKRPVPVTALGADVETPGYLSPLNFYSDPNSRVTVVLQLDQPVNPASSNVNASTVLMQYLVDEANPGLDANWANVPHSVQLAANCTVTGAIVRVTPTGILPQGRLVRIALTPDFRDIVGNGGLLTTVVASFRVRTATNPGTTTPGLTADAATENFTIPGNLTGSGQDTTAVLDAPPAIWGTTTGELKASFNFGGTGGPGGAFVYRVRQQVSGSTIFNTSFQSITNEDQSLTQPCVNGQIDVKDFIVDPNAVLEIRGPNACVIRASGKVDINGRIFLRGANSRGVVSFSTANLPEAGATGNAGGGRGGTGSPLTTQSTPRGEAGFGAFGLINGGGGGGESGVNVNFNNARPGGGGGGSFATDVPRLLTATTINPACPEQSIIGLDAEDGAPGSPQAIGAQHPGVLIPEGGIKGPRPFTNLNPVDPIVAALDDDLGTPTQAFFHIDDFWGSMLIGTTIIRGELANPGAGAGGGAGGDAVISSTFPLTPFNGAIDKKGAGGGGGGGSLTILCLGTIKFGAAGRIDASGGTGGGGENTSGINRVGGGSGGGSGGHVILQAGGDIDFTLCAPGNAAQNYSTGAGIFARGGQGGEGINGVGGTNPPSIETPPTQDMLPPNSYGAGALCAVTGNAVGVVVCAGGDGGPGVIQLHVSDLSKIKVPTTNNPFITPAGPTKISHIIRPNPIGTTPINTDVPANWRQLLPIFGRNSKAVSKWVALGSTSVPPTGSTPKPVTFFHAGTNTTTGFVNSTFGNVPELSPILTGTLAASPALPFIAADGRSVVFDTTAITDDVYLRNPALVRQFVLRVSGATVRRFEITGATYDSTANTLRVTVADSGSPLAMLTGTAAVIPRFFRVAENGTFDTLSSSSSIKIEFQAAPAAPSGLPNESLTTPWVTNITALNTSVSPANTTLRFFRFRVSFEIGIGAPNLNFDTPTPSIDFLKTPFKF
ncbi:MAG: hypothetical protein JNL28_05410 [Planctomycetes bacterium]|nr:hypothetical protein [Planctomycetota bacterium]